MTRLYIVRHAEAVPKHIDPKRPLTEQGKTAVANVGTTLKNSGICVNIIYHSEKTRARETAEILKSIINPSCRLILKEGLLPDDSVDAIYNEIKDQKDDLMIVGHLPFVTRLASKLVSGSEEGGAIPFRAGAVALFEKENDRSWHLKDVISPK